LRTLFGGCLLIFLFGCPGRTGTFRADAQVFKRGDANIQKVICFFSKNPWQSFDNQSDRNPEGFKYSLYLLNNAGDAVFGDGVIHTELYVVDDLEGGQDRKKIKEWSLNNDQALGYRFKNERRWGWGYGLIHQWDEIDVLGKRIEIVVSFERTDGRRIYAQTKPLLVPRPIGARVPTDSRRGGFE
jgi:hypothetical protein